MLRWLRVRFYGEPASVAAPVPAEPDPEPVILPFTGPRPRLMPMPWEGESTLSIYDPPEDDEGMAPRVEVRDALRLYVGEPERKG
jgi:hypothetical protein